MFNKVAMIIILAGCLVTGCKADTGLDGTYRVDCGNTSYYLTDVDWNSTWYAYQGYDESGNRVVPSEHCTWIKID